MHLKNTRFKKNPGTILSYIKCVARLEQFSLDLSTSVIVHFALVISQRTLLIHLQVVVTEYPQRK